MGAYCVFGVSRTISRQLAEKQTPTFEGGDLNRRELTMAEWVARRDALATKLFDTTEKPYRISPELDSPQFCADWMAVSPGEIRLAKIMVRGPKLDGGGQPDNAPWRAGDDLGGIHTHRPIQAGTPMKKIYIAGPMTGLPELNFPAFHAAAAELRTAGHHVINPAEINTDPSAAWVDCMRADIAQLVTCDTIHLLAGWSRSRGATLEHHIASQLDMEITGEPA